MQNSTPEQAEQGTDYMEWAVQLKRQRVWWDSLEK